MISPLALVFAAVLVGSNAFLDNLPTRFSGISSRLPGSLSGLTNNLPGSLSDLTSNLPGSLSDLTNKLPGSLSDLTQNLPSSISSKIPDLSKLPEIPNLSDFKLQSLAPKCEFSGNLATCCSGLSQVIPAQLCANFLINYNELNVIGSLSFNNNTLIQRKVEVGKVCVPVLSIPTLTACLHFYWVEIGVGSKPEDFKSNICFQGSVSSIASVDFKCLRFENGKFSLNAEHQPSSKGWLNYDLGK